MKDSLHFLLQIFLKKENFKINYEELKLQLLCHPSYPSLHAITGVLDHFSIENMALEVPQNIETLKQLPTYFISMIADSSEFILVTQHEHTIEYIDSHKKRKTIAIDQFLEIWKGIIVVIEKKAINETAKKIGSNTITPIFYVTGILLLLGLFFFAKPSLFEFLHFTLVLIGVTISLLIVKHELGFQSKAVNKFCTATKATSCDAVLNSKGAEISKYFKLSDISLIYFIGLALAWVLLAQNSMNIFAIVALTFVSLPVTFYSIYYQYKVIKKWCPLCLGIVTVLWLQCCTLLVSDSTLTKIQFDFTSTFVLFFSFLISTSLWMFIKPLLSKQQKLEKLEIEHYRFKRNFDLFNAVYSKNKNYNTSLGVNNDIILGNKNALIRLLVVTNPSCFYCKAAHNDLEKILKSNGNDVSVTIRFNVPEDKNNNAHKVAVRIIELYNTEPESKCLDALHEAYKKEVDLNKWLLKWGESKDNCFENVLKETKEWCIANTINFTPALFINGKEFPKIYDRGDLHYFIDDLIEQVETDVIQPKNMAIAT